MNLVTKTENYRRNNMLKQMLSSSFLVGSFLKREIMWAELWVLEKPSCMEISLACFLPPSPAPVQFLYSDQAYFSETTNLLRLFPFLKHFWWKEDKSTGHRNNPKATWWNSNLWQWFEWRETHQTEKYLPCRSNRTWSGVHFKEYKSLVYIIKNY